MNDDDFGRVVAAFSTGSRNWRIESHLGKLDLYEDCGPYVVHYGPCNDEEDGRAMAQTLEGQGL